MACGKVMTDIMIIAKNGTDMFNIPWYASSTNTVVKKILKKE